MNRACHIQGSQLCSYDIEHHFMVINVTILYAGKSTLLNALLGAICLPSSNVPETARITRIIHTPLKDGKQPQLTYQPSGSHEQRTIVGEYGIRKLFASLHCALCKFHSIHFRAFCLADCAEAKHAQQPLQVILQDHSELLHLLYYCTEPCC